MFRAASVAFTSLAFVVLGWLAAPHLVAATQSSAFAVAMSPAAIVRRAAVLRQPPAVTEVLRSGVLIVISKPVQRMYVFKDGAIWMVAPVSTGRRGHATPSGVFPILQKALYHRSNIYSGAPMPYMQRITWSGIAIHKGRLPGYPASHGCIRLPHVFARELFALTRPSATTVVITDAALPTQVAARRLASNTPMPHAPVRLAAQQLDDEIDLRQDVRSDDSSPAQSGSPSVPPLQGLAPPQTIQLASVVSLQQAETAWSQMIGRHPELGRFRKTVVPAVVNAHQFYRLRASAPGAYALCSTLKAAGEACFKVY